MPFYKYRPKKQHGRYNTLRFMEQSVKQLKARIQGHVVPQELKALGVKIIDPNFDPLPPVGLLSKWAKPTLDTRPHPLAKDTPAYLYNGSDPFAEGVKQACVLGKAVLRRGLPDSLLSRIDSVGSDEADVARCHRAITISQCTDSTVDRLPKRLNPDFPYWHHPQYRGIPERRKTSVLLDNMFRYANALATQRNLDASLRRIPLRHGNVNVVFPRNGTLIRSAFEPQMFVMSDNATDAVRPQVRAAAAEISGTADEHLHDLHPISPLIDLEKQDAYDDATQYPLTNYPVSTTAMPLATPAINTILVNKIYDYKYPWSDEETTTHLVMHTLTAALAVARRKYLAPPGKTAPSTPSLPEPVVVAGVQCCRNIFDFTLVQINTIDLDHDGGVKNIVWVDNHNPMFRLNNFYEPFQGVEEYEHDVFRKFLALTLHDVKL